MGKHSLVRTIYLYLFSLVGLVLIIIGTVNFLDMGLKAFVFKKAEQQEALNYMQPPSAEPVMNKVPAEVKPGESVRLSSEDYQQVQYLIADYKNWKQRQSEIDYISANRQKRASINLSLIIVGLPLYLYHWLIINHEKKTLLSQVVN